MRQLTGLDAQSLALESPNQAGHVSGFGDLDPSTRPNGRLELSDILNLIAERLPLLAPFRWRLKPVSLGLDYRYWIDDPNFDLEYHVRELALAPPATDEKLAEQSCRCIWPESSLIVSTLEADRLARGVVGRTASARSGGQAAGNAAAEPVAEAQQRAE